MIRTVRLLRNVALTVGGVVTLVGTESAVIWGIRVTWRSGEWVATIAFAGLGLLLIGAVCGLLSTLHEQR